MVVEGEAAYGLRRDERQSRLPQGSEGGERECAGRRDGMTRRRGRRRCRPASASGCSRVCLSSATGLPAICSPSVPTLCARPLCPPSVPTLCAHSLCPPSVAALCAPRTATPPLHPLRAATPTHPPRQLYHCTCLRLHFLINHECNPPLPPPPPPHPHPHPHPTPPRRSDRVAGAGCFGAALMMQPGLVADCMTAMAEALAAEAAAAEAEAAAATAGAEAAEAAEAAATATAATVTAGGAEAEAAGAAAETATAGAAAGAEAAGAAGAAAANGSRVGVTPVNVKCRLGVDECDSYAQLHEFVKVCLCVWGGRGDGGGWGVARCQPLG